MDEIKVLQDGNRTRHEGPCAWCRTFSTHLKPSDRWMQPGELICNGCQNQLTESKR